MARRVVTVEIDGRRVTLEVPPNATTDEIHSVSREYVRSLKTQSQDKEIARERFQQEEAGTINPFRPQVREFMEGLSPGDQFVGGAVLPTLGGLAGGMGGGLGGELLSQELGLSPFSKTSAAMSVAVPAGLSALRRTPHAISGASRMFPGIREAIVKREIELTSKWTDDVAGMLGAKPAKPLWEALKKSGAQFQRSSLTRTSSAVDEIIAEAEKKASAFPEARDVAALGKSIRETLLSERGAPRQIAGPGPGGRIRGGGITLPGHKNQPLDIVELHSNISSLGRQVGRLEGQGGLSEGARKKLYKAFFDDFETVPVVSESGQALKLLNEARAATKTGYAIQDADNVIQGAFGKPSIDGKRTFDAGAALKRIQDMANPKHKAYDKNFTEGLGEKGLSKLTENLERVHKLNLTPLGPGKLIQAGIWALIGRSVGGATGIPGAAEFGALTAVNVPSRFTQMLLTSKGSRFTDTLIQMGKGQVSDRSINAMGQLLRKSGEDPDTAGGILGSFMEAIPSGLPAPPTEEGIRRDLERLRGSAR